MLPSYTGTAYEFLCSACTLYNDGCAPNKVPFMTYASGSTLHILGYEEKSDANSMLSINISKLRLVYGALSRRIQEPMIDAILVKDMTTRKYP